MGRAGVVSEDRSAEVDDVPPGTISSDEYAAQQRRAAEPPSRWHTFGRRLVKGVGLLMVVMVAYLAVTFLQVWRSSSQEGEHSADAIVVLGAAQYDGRPSPVLEARLKRGLDLYQQGFAPLIVVTGGRQAGDTFTEATSGYIWLRERGVPDEAIRKEVQGRTSYQSLAASARFLRDEGLDEVLLVTDGYHALRVGAIAREVGLVAHVSRVDMDGGPRLPQLLRETAAVAAGRIVGHRRLNNWME